MAEAFLQRFDNLTVWQRGDERAPHKPLLALWAIGQCLQGRSRLIEYDEIHQALRVLLTAFGPPRKNYKPQEPFWRMQKDRIWEVPHADRVPVQPNGSVAPTILRQQRVQGGFPSPLYEAFRNDHALAFMIARQLADAHFPETMHSAVLEATLGEHAFLATSSESSTVDGEWSPLLTSSYKRRLRNPKFRNQVLEQYGHRCAVCAYCFEFPPGHWPALEAAHIKWHSHRGPDAPENGISLCVLHHELFDWGIYSIEPESLNVVVANAALAQVPESPVAKLHGAPLQVVPDHVSDRPAAKNLIWHKQNVFRGG